ncbi:DUF3298 and DUF4163 domain-containing protein [Gramella sp. GC03-9]|uniref:DUF3298 and DUF4163 domain-containing protein n=1 Tax=Christiangramia oceanisediminis TaxID=2920386 RepID=A0A9X2I801_9FLAO|nr:DUF3298 and DUF4163 domain-containing protein [Gramella oceanisediminis]MCP9199146.1 DUF3298 and DUF4163 domain-containing protein [Gramella oceanisediminis]
MKKFGILLGLVSLFIACADDPKEKDQKEPDESLQFTSKNIEKSLENCLPEDGECTFISLNFPLAEGTGFPSVRINRQIVQFLNNTIDYQEDGGILSPDELADNFIANYRETAQEFPEYELPWEATILGKVVYWDDEIISLRFKTNMFTGGAHGYESTNFLNFDPESGNSLKTEDLFTAEFIDFVEQDFRKKNKIPENSNINSTGMFFENDSFHLPQNIGITQDQVILHYNAYEIAPYSSGNFTLIYPHKELEKYLKLDFKKEPEL